MSRFIIFLLGFFLSLQASAMIALNPTLDGPESARWDRYKALAERAQEIVNKPEFKAAIISRNYSFTKLTGTQVWDLMEQGKELKNPGGLLGVWEWKVGFYTRCSSKVIGWTNSQIMTVWVNKCVYDKLTDGAIVANIVHEYLHKIGLDHKNAKDHNSAPYWIGYLAEKLYNNLTTVEVKPVQVKKSLWAKIKSWFD